MSSDKPPSSAVTLRNNNDADARPDSLVLIGDNLFMSRKLPPAGTGHLSIGRDDSCDIKVDHASVSRRHAVLHIGDGIELEDLGSSNGTRVGGSDLAAGQRVAVTQHDVVTLGSITLFLQNSATSKPAYDDGLEPIVESAAMRALYARIDRVAASEINVLIVGETGSGKELVADRIHRQSARRNGPMMRLNCAALAETLIESELFGHEKGAFTGASAVKVGLLEAANGGTVFLDEVGELPAAAQAKLLRALENREVMRVGAVATHTIDVRFIAATHRELTAQIADGKFREDLYYRLHGITLTVPPLRERTEEIEPLATHFAKLVQLRTKSPPRTLSPGAMNKLRGHSWPGNVRELRNVVERAAVLAETETIESQDIVFDGRKATEPPSAASAETSAVRDEIINALEVCAGNQTRAARMLGISRRTLINRLDQYGIARPRKK